MKSDFLVSVIVPIYKVESYLSHCVDSILRQTYYRIEVILIDDGSPDRCGAICDEYAKQDKRIKVIHQDNMGLSGARNTGIDVAVGEYVAFVDGDDWIHPKYIETMLEACIDNNCTLCQCDFFNVVDDYTPRNEYAGSVFTFETNEFVKAEYEIYSWNCVVAWNKLYHRSLFDGIRYPLGRLHEDEYTTYKIISAAERVALITDKLYYYRRRDDGIMQGECVEKRRSDVKKALEERIAYYEANEELVLAKWARDRYENWRGSIVGGEDKYLLKQQVFPFAQIEPGSRIVLYGAGKVGLSYYKQIISTNYCRINNWIDRNALELRKNGYAVEENVTLEQLEEVDYVVVALTHWNIAREVINIFEKEYGVDRSRIVHCIKGVLVD